MGLLDRHAVIITGAGRGLGRAYASAAAQAGAAVVVNDVDADAAAAVVAEIETAGGLAIASSHSVADFADSAALVRAAVDAFGRLDGLVNNAGRFALGTPWEIDEAMARSMIDVNVLGPMFVGGHALAVMREQGTGSIVNIVSGAAFGQRGSTIYGTTKGAMMSLTYNWAFELEGTGIRVNGVSPLATTAMSATFQQHFGTTASTEWPAERVAPIVTYLLGPASRRVRGQVFRFDRDTLSLLRRGAVAESEHRDGWTPDDVADWAARHVERNQEPLGMHTLAGIAADTPAARTNEQRNEARGD